MRSPAPAAQRRRVTPGDVVVLASIVVALLVVACRPAIADNTGVGQPAAPTPPGATQNLVGVNASDLPSPVPTEVPGTTSSPVPVITPEPSLEEIATAVPAQALKPVNQVTVQANLFHGFEAEDASLLYAAALSQYDAVNIVVNLSPPLPGTDIFALNPAPDVLPVWIGTVADAAAGAKEGVTLEAVGELVGRDSTVLVTPKKASKEVSALKGKVLVEDPQATADLAAAGLPNGVKLVHPDDPSAPFDPTALINGDVSAAAVSEYEGWARVQEAAVNAGLSASSFVATPLHDDADPLLGELIWVQPTDMNDPDLKAGVTAFLGVVAQAEVECRDNLDDCSGNAASQSDRSQDGIAWSIDQLDSTLFPSTDGILHMDPDAWSRTIASDGKSITTGISDLTFTNDLVDAVLKALSSIDIYGKGWKPEGRKLFP